MFTFGVTVTRLRAPLAVDAYSGAATSRDWTAAVSLSSEGFAVDPGGSVEASTVNREQITTTPTLMGPYGADVAASDRVLVNGVTWEVVGNRSDYLNPFTGWQAGSTWPLRRVEG